MRYNALPALILWLIENDINWIFYYKKSKHHPDGIKILTDDKEALIFIKLKFSCSD